LLTYLYDFTCIYLTSGEAPWMRKGRLRAK
jgi:hypothetical protein